ncbi:MAG: hypothetical protein A2Z95_06095 [Gallionellales bacterium GWA2_60_18]|nr:MAG: hypothetical protein A2Z95_06095 [Gallionellales bacterium GWA2_60_18]
MAISKEQWKEIEARLSNIMGRVELVCDGYRVNAVVESSKMRLYVAVYVNGEIKGSWADGKGEIPQKFCQATKRYLYSATKRAKAKKAAARRGVGADLRKWYTGVAESSIVSWMPWWTNSKAFCRHIRKTCTSIELVKIGY